MNRINRYWNRIAYFVIEIGRRMLWDYTGRIKNVRTIKNAKIKEKKEN